LRTLFTIHNLGYQGKYPKSLAPAAGLEPSQVTPGGVEFYGDINFLKSGIVYSDAINTVSRRYAAEIQTPEYGFGLDGLLRSRAHALSGIVNGVDYSEWSPETDPYIAAHYSASDLSGKRKCKFDLLHEFHLPTGNLEKPVLGIVSRLAAQKGFDLLASLADELMSLDVFLVVVGSGEPAYEELLKNLAARNPNRVGVWIGYDNRRAHKVEAGADIFLMPSHYEPCGLNQIYSLRYGTLPIVRATGGLDDTIEEGTGFKFWDYTGDALMGAIRYALAAYTDRHRWTGMMRLAMSQDFSWDHSAKEYTALYQRLLAG
jgi:starch synthase